MEWGMREGLERKACRGFPYCIIELSGRFVNSMTSSLESEVTSTRGLSECVMQSSPHRASAEDAG